MNNSFCVIYDLVDRSDKCTIDYWGNIAVEK